MNKKINRNYLEINSLSELVEANKPAAEYQIKLIDPPDFLLNRFFYKSIGKKHKWIDRLAWSEEKWISYVSSENIETFVLKYKDDLVGFFELILHQENKEIEIAYFGILEEYQNKKLGSFLLSEAIRESLHKKSVERVWLHTCSLDHKNALNNYLARGMKIFKTEIINI